MRRLNRRARGTGPRWSRRNPVYRVWIDYKDGQSKSQDVASEAEADALLSQWQAIAPSHDSGFVLLDEARK